MKGESFAVPIISNHVNFALYLDDFAVKVVVFFAGGKWVGNFVFFYITILESWDLWARCWRSSGSRGRGRSNGCFDDCQAMR